MASNDQSSNQESQASMLGGHIKYAQGAISSALGYETGEQTKKDAISEMKEANAQSDSQPPAQSSVLGTVESALGSATGCEGMQQEGESRKPAAGAGIEEQNGTG